MELLLWSQSRSSSTHETHAPTIRTQKSKLSNLTTALKLDWLEDLAASQHASEDCTRDDGYACTRDSCILL
ncbi:hypothetical protein CY35_12G003300 [Sphagnum magellanicum]|nr:hypothetical protein CY35_12G003300 [Sphagnum magellanicum]